MKMHRPWILLAATLLALAPFGLTQSAPPAATRKKAPAKSAVPAPLVNLDIIRLVQAKLSDDLILSKIKISKTRFDTSVDGLIALREAGVSDRLIAVMINPTNPAPVPAVTPAQAPATPAQSTLPAPSPPATAPGTTSGATPSNAGNDASPTGSVIPKAPVSAKAADPVQAPQNYGIYVQENGELKAIGRVQTRVQLGKARTVVQGSVPFMREKIDISIPGAHSTSRYETLRPAFYAYFPASRDVNKFKLLQAKITGQKLDQRTIANASILFSTEQNQDEVLCDISPTTVRDFYRISPREDLPNGEFGFVEGNTGSKSTSESAIIDVWDFAIDRKEDKVPLPEYLSSLPAANLPDATFLEWAREDCQKIVDDREGKLSGSGSMMGIFKRQFAGLDVYWADRQFAQAFARLEMLDKELTPEQARKLAGLLMANSDDQFYVLVSMGTKIGAGKLAGANEGERVMRPFDATLTNDKGKDIVPASRLEFVGGYAGLWKVTFDQKSIRGWLMGPEGGELNFEARLNQNLDFKAKFLTTFFSTKP